MQYFKLDRHPWNIKVNLWKETTYKFDPKQSLDPDCRKVSSHPDDVAKGQHEQLQFFFHKFFKISLNHRLVFLFCHEIIKSQNHRCKNRQFINISRPLHFDQKYQFSRTLFNFAYRVKELAIFHFLAKISSMISFDHVHISCHILLFTGYAPPKWSNWGIIRP